jgi:hypothetical protein
MNEKELRALDAWIAESLFSWKRNNHESRKAYDVYITPDGEHKYVGGAPMGMPYECDHPDNDMFAPTTDPAAAMQVLGECSRQVQVTVWKRVNDWQVFSQHMQIHGEGETLPLAICKFARQLFERSKTQ